MAVGRDCFQGFQAWIEVLAFMHQGSSTDLRKNRILLAIFEARDRSQDQRWHSVLLAIFWPTLGSLFHSRNYLDRDPEVLWSNLYWVFLETVRMIDITKRQDRLVQKIFNDTLHRLSEVYAKERARKNREHALEKQKNNVLEGDEEDAWEPGTEDLGLAAVHLDLMREAEIRRLRVHVEKGRISEADFLLVVGTRVYGYSLADWARQTGMSHEGAKKRRQRVEGLLKKLEKRWEK